MTEAQVTAACDQLATTCGWKIVLPWAVLQHDNHRLMPKRGRLIISPRYRQAKELACAIIRRTWTLPMVRADVAVTGCAYFPDRRRRDAGNYRKLITDALAGIVYADDSQITDERWIRIGIDRVNPRFEMEIRW